MSNVFLSDGVKTPIGAIDAVCGTTSSVFDILIKTTSAALNIPPMASNAQPGVEKQDMGERELNQI
jgi:hypothetical protein